MLPDVTHTHNMLTHTFQSPHKHSQRSLLLLLLLLLLGEQVKRGGRPKREKVWDAQRICCPNIAR